MIEIVQSYAPPKVGGSTTLARHTSDRTSFADVAGLDDAAKRM